MRRDSFRRQDLLPSHVHGLESAMGDNLGMHEMGQGLDDVQVSVFVVVVLLKVSKRHT